MDSSNLGLAAGDFDGSRCILRDIGERSATMSAANWVKARLPARGACVLALDSPLGWPGALGRVLSGHRAGELIDTPPDELFRRRTDRFIKKKLGKQPLDVGADRIARTAVASLRLLDEIRVTAKREIPLAWTPAPPSDAVAIEVYPAATLLGHGLPSARYKRRENERERGLILEGLKREVAFTDPRHSELAAKRADTLDAIVCILAAVDFLTGHVLLPPIDEVTRREGWIWARPRAPSRGDE